MRTNYQIEMMDGFVVLNTLSPNHKYYFRIKKPREVAMGVFASSLAFFNASDDLIYCTPKNINASYLPPYECFNNVVWLNDGDCAFFIEYQRNNSYLCVLSFEEKICYKRKMIPSEDIGNVLNQLNESQNLSDLLMRARFSKYFINDIENFENFKENLFNRWYPR